MSSWKDPKALQFGALVAGLTIGVTIGIFVGKSGRDDRVLALEEERDTAQRERADLAEQISSLPKDYGSLKRERDEFALRNATLQRDYASLEEERDRLVEQNGGLQEECALLKEERDEFALRNSSLQKDYALLKEECDGLAEQNSNLQKDRASLKEERDRLVNELAAIDRILLPILRHTRDTSPTSARIEAILGPVVESEARTNYLVQKYRNAPKSGWVRYGEPCPSGDGHKHTHPLMHERAFDVVKARNGSNELERDRRPVVDDELLVRREVVVFSDEPERQEKDKCYGVKDWYLPEEPPRGILVPGQKVRVIGINDEITCGYWYVEYKLVVE